ncbi:MAG: hypothetical protein AB2551_11055 [Candidatus Thiodiazotropha sp.]
MIFSPLGNDLLASRYSIKTTRGTEVVKRVNFLHEKHGVKISSIFLSNSSSEYQLYKRLKRGEQLTHTSLLCLERCLDKTFVSLADDKKIWTQEEILATNISSLISYLEYKIGPSSSKHIRDNLDLSHYAIFDTSSQNLVPLTYENLVFDTNVWIPNRLSLTVFKEALNLLGDEVEIERAGKFSVLNTDLRYKAAWAILMMSPAKVIERVTKENESYNRTKVVTIESLSANSAVIKAEYKQNLTHLDSGEYVIPSICAWNKGLYHGYMSLGGAKNICIKELACVTRGDECCVFQANWTETLSIFKRIRAAIRLFQN